MRPPPTTTLVPCGLRLGDAALARAPWQREPRQTEQNAPTEDAGRRKPGRPRKTTSSAQAAATPNVPEATAAETEDAEMLDIPADDGRDGRDTDMGFVGSLEPAHDDCIG